MFWSDVLTLSWLFNVLGSLLLLLSLDGGCFVCLQDFLCGKGDGKSMFMSSQASSLSTLTAHDGQTG